MDYLPIFLNLNESRCLVVGGGSVATRKIDLLIKAGGSVDVIATELCAELKQRHARGEISYQQSQFDASDLQGVSLVIAATDDIEINRSVAQAARQRNIPVNVVDQPELCSFIMPAIIDRSPLQIAISSGGKAPVLARQLRAHLESTIPANYAKLAGLMGRYRAALKDKLPNVDLRRKFWEKVLSGPIAQAALSGKQQRADKELQQAITHANPGASSGEVYLVGAGPGDPDLLTFRALRLMQQADVIVYDRLVSAAILDLARRDADRIYAGKERSKHHLTQDGINQLLIDLAKQGKRVCRLKGGDPFIFGRGGEEIATLFKEGISFQVVPGITAAAGCASYAGIPLTHRDYAQACVFVTGHLKNNKVDLNWPMLVHPQQTVVIYMGLHGLSVICQQLIKHGRDEKTPAALVQQGTTDSQKVIIADLKTLPEKVSNSQVKAPTLIIVGEVVKLHEQLNWFEP